MPCNSDYMQQTEREAEIQHAAALLQFALKSLGRPIPENVQHQAGAYYAHDEKIIPSLCALLRGLSELQREALIYDARNRTSRSLADWWETHQAIDREREKHEKTKLMAAFFDGEG